eukprot:SAG11_NODE_5953_length_1425_cov_20.383861_1_plen_158_part_00
MILLLGVLYFVASPVGIKQMPTISENEPHDNNDVSQRSTHVAAAPAKTKERYKKKTIMMAKSAIEVAENTKISAYFKFEAKLTTKLDESQVNTTSPELETWAKKLSENKGPHGRPSYKCMQETPDAYDKPPMDTEEPLISIIDRSRGQRGGITSTTQ